MDVIAHGLWTNLAYELAKKSKKIRQTIKPRDRWWMIAFGILPDAVSFGPYIVVSILGAGSLFSYAFGRFMALWGGTPVGAVTENTLGRPFAQPDPSLIPEYVYHLYDYSHSLVIFALVFGLIWLIRKKPYIPLLGWGLHVAIDIFSHGAEFFPTPFLIPLS